MPSPQLSGPDGSDGLFTGIPAENFPLPQGGEGGRVIALDQVLQAEPANGTVPQVNPLAVAGFLQVKGQISSSTIRRLKAGESVSTNTLDALCKILQCDLHDVVEYLPDNNT